MNTTLPPCPKDLEGFTELDKTKELPFGYSVLSNNDGAFVAVAPDSARSLIFASYEKALNWAISHEFVNSERYPNVGELWVYAERDAIICGNFISDQNTIWVMDWNSGDRGDAPINKLEQHEDRMTLSECVIIERFTEWAKQGNDDAMWWLGWWYEGKNHAKSVWFYIAALRANPQEYDWAYDRILGDALQPGGMCEGVPMPDLAFLKDIPEVQGMAINNDWYGAVLQAEMALPIPAKEQYNTRMIVARYSAPADKIQGISIDHY